MASNTQDSTSSRQNETDRVTNLDLSKDPLSTYFLSTSDGPKSVLATPALDGNNYHSWSRSEDCSSFKGKVRVHG